MRKRNDSHSSNHGRAGAYPPPASRGGRGQLFSLPLREGRGGLFPRSLCLGSLLLLLIAGCARHTIPGATPIAQIDNGVRVVVSSEPAPPRVGDNTFSFMVTDAATNQPIVNANVTVNAFNQLTNGNDRQTGRSQGDGTYQVPMKFGIPDAYRMDVLVQRTGKPDAQVKFIVEARQGG